MAQHIVEGDPVREAAVAFATILVSLALLAAAVTAAWFLMYHFALKKLPPVQEALGLRKRDKPTLAEMRHEIDMLKETHRASLTHQRGSGGSMQPNMTRVRARK